MHCRDYNKFLKKSKKKFTQEKCSAKQFIPNPIISTYFKNDIFDSDLHLRIVKEQVFAIQKRKLLVLQLFTGWLFH